MKRIKLVFFLIGIICLVSCSHHQKSSISGQDLSGRWEFRKVGDSSWMEAIVPGTVHTDLYKNVKIDDPFYRDNEIHLQWIDKEDWEYRKYFESNHQQSRGTTTVLQFNGVDTYSKIYLNDELILETDNMFRVWEVDVSDLLKKSGLNEIRLILQSPISSVKPVYLAQEYHLPAANDQADKKFSVYTRKAPFHYGWDWGPRFVTSGIWRPVLLLTKSGLRIESSYFKKISLSETKASYQAIYQIHSTIKREAIIELRNFSTGEVIGNLQTQLVKGVNELSVPMTIDNPKLWWPNGMGEQQLYLIEAVVKSGQHECSRKDRIGLRDIKLVREADAWGESFYFRVNGRPVFAKGANYIPQDNFQNHVMPSEYKHLLSSAKEANMNMIRVWGGGIYENDQFYNLCDELGLLVWQDFMFACSMYPGDSAFLQSIEAEAVGNIIRLRNHPCLALWCGNNEVQDAWHQWGWQFKYQDAEKTNISQTYQDLFHKLLPDLVTAYDPQTNYWPSSPASGPDYGQTSTTTSGDFHYWGVWHGRRDFESYAQVIPRFSSEFGFQSFPEFKTIQSYTLPEDRNIESPVMKAHQRHPVGNELIRNYMERYYVIPADFEEFIYLSQVMQAEGMRIALEGLRRHRPQCMGALYWQLNDCWPVASWSGIDYFGRWKSLHFQAKRSYAPLLISISEAKDSLEVHLVSDLNEEIIGELSIELLAFDGRVGYHHEMPASFSPDQSKLVFKIPSQDLLVENIGRKQAFVTAKFVSARDTIQSEAFYFERAKDLDLPAFQMSHEVLEEEDGWYMWLTSTHLMRQVYIRYDGETEVRMDENYFDLQPKQKKKIRIHKRDQDSIKPLEFRIFTLNQIKA